jgi:hypothetical protein
MAPENTYSRTLDRNLQVGRGATHPKADSIVLNAHLC